MYSSHTCDLGVNISRQVCFKASYNAWYAHLKDMNDQPWVVAALTSWGIALFEYAFHTQVSP